ncbi:MAG: carboxymuconolactone decarboxylase family protein [Jatrophihabitans sp.]|uniref:carboxymuconolactone decarboxylase family protein n=1 Tax=Jatrophihabitans sp. TaxID=1932789 RepID=UPI003F7F0C41
MSRIAPGGLREAGPFAWGFAHLAGLVAGTNPPRLFLTMGRSHKLFRGWLRFAGRLMPGGNLPRRETELVILRVAHLRGCEYEFTHHVKLGARAGVTPADVDRVRSGPDADGWSPREAALLAAVDQLHHTQDLDDDMWSRLRTHLDEADTVEFVLLVGHYEMLATFLLTLRVEPDRPRR